MPKFTFDSDALGRAFGVAKVVKPMTGDFALKFFGDKLVIYSTDKRRYARAEVVAKSTDGVEEGYQSEEFYVMADRQTLLDSDLSNVTMTITDKGVSVRADGDGQVRNATLKKRADNSKRPPIPKAPPISGVSVKARLFEEVLRQVSCSAQIKETKTEEDMRINQVHFYSEHECAMSSARFCGSAVMLKGLGLDLSVVSADIPPMKGFCARLGDGDVIVSQDKSHLYLSDPAGSVVCFSRVASSKPPFQLLTEDGYDTIVHVTRDQLVRSLQWATMTIEGTQRLTIKAFSNGSGPVMEFWNGTQEISRMPVEIVLGTEIQSDFPVKVLAPIISQIEGDKIALKYGHRDLKTVLEISAANPPESGQVHARHFLQSMKVR